ncbi:hypothetical protein LTR12_014856 [Friedmanniomyces endolithicus]|nr:hypothetical protein LTR12_014856 [Friedmanniomyces endolithicus]
MTEEMHGFEEDGVRSEAYPLCQENKVLRGRLTELTEQLAESEERRVTLLQKMNATEFELTRIRGENDFLKRVMSEMNVNAHIGRADLMKADTEVAVENSEVESTEERKGPRVRIGGSCEEKGAADVHIANDLTTRHSNGSAKAEETMTPIHPVQERCGGQISPGCHVLAAGGLKGQYRSGQSTPSESPLIRNHGAADPTSPSMSRKVQDDIFDDGSDAGNGSPGPGWRGDPVRTTTKFVPSGATAEATNCASPELQDLTSSSEHSSSVEFQGFKDAPTDETAADLAKGISTGCATSSPEATPAQSPTGQSAQSWASEEDDEHMMTLSLPSPNRGSGAVCDKPTTAFERSENGPSGEAEALPALPEPCHTASVVSPASPVTTPATEATLKVGTGSSTSPSPSFSPLVNSEASTEGQLNSLEGTSAVQPATSSDGELSHKPYVADSTSQDVVAPESVPFGMSSPISHLGEDPPRVTPPLSATSHGGAISSPELPLGGPTTQAESRKAQFSPPSEGVVSPGLRESHSPAASQSEVASPKEATVMGQTRLDDVSSPILGSQVGDSDSASGDEPSSPLMHKTSRRLKTSGAGAPASKSSKARTRMRPIGSMIDDSGAKGTSQRRERPEDTIRKSYTKFGLDASRLIITHEPHTIHPLALYMGSTAKTLSDMTHGRLSKLSSARDGLLAYIPAAGDSGVDQKNIDLVRRLAHSPTAEEDAPRLVDVVKALRRRSDVAADELNLFRCLEGLAVMVAKQHNEGEYREALEGWSKHDIERVHIYHCLNYVLLHLVEDWRGLHLLVLVFLRESSTLQMLLRARVDTV